MTVVVPLRPLSLHPRDSRDQGHLPFRLKHKSACIVVVDKNDAILCAKLLLGLLEVFGERDPLASRVRLIDAPASTISDPSLVDSCLTTGSFCPGLTLVRVVIEEISSISKSSSSSTRLSSSESDSVRSITSEILRAGFHEFLHLCRKQLPSVLTFGARHYTGPIQSR